MKSLADLGVLVPNILLPANPSDPLWPCIACDQYTAQPALWEEAERQVGGAFSTLRLIVPEAFLQEAPRRLPNVHAAMGRYLNEVLTQSFEGFVLTARTTQSGTRLGLVMAVDLEKYDYLPGSTSPIRATEGTILDRIPPRMAVRQGAALEASHILLLVDDIKQTLLPPLYEQYQAQQPLYDVELMLGGGHLKGWAITDSAAMESIRAALEALDQARGKEPLFAVGDGNHSLASARACWLEKKASLPEGAVHPLRYAMVELTNLHDSALRFTPIHRVLFHAEPEETLAALLPAGEERGEVTLIWPDGDQVVHGVSLSTLQTRLDAFLAQHPQTQMDYIHGEETAAQLGRAPGNVALLLSSTDKYSLFSAIAGGPFPRKAFSLGEANEKRYYMECRALG